MYRMSLREIWFWLDWLMMLSNLHATRGQCILHGCFVQLGKYIITLRGRWFLLSSRKEVITWCSVQSGWKIKPRAIIGELIICQSLICHQVSVITFIITGIHFAQSSSAPAVSRPDWKSSSEVEGFFWSIHNWVTGSAVSWTINSFGMVMERLNFILNVVWAFFISAVFVFYLSDIEMCVFWNLLPKQLLMLIFSAMKIASA